MCTLTMSRLRWDIAIPFYASMEVSSFGFLVCGSVAHRCVLQYFRTGASLDFREMRRLVGPVTTNHNLVGRVERLVLWQWISR